MVLSNDDINRIKTESYGKTYTFDEAIEYMKMLDSFPTGDNSVNWVNARTGQPVAIGYNANPQKINKK